MGSTQSTHTTTEIKEPSFSEKVTNRSVSGRKTSTDIVHAERVISAEDEDDISVTSSEAFYSSDEETEEEGKICYAVRGRLHGFREKVSKARTCLLLQKMRNGTNVSRSFRTPRISAS
jgi:hypothetical protein